jgi:hypothetical protein
MAEQSGKLGAIISKAWTDDAFRKRLLADTAATLKSEGVEVPEGFQIRAVENSEKVYHLVLPARPQMNEAQRAKAASEAGAGSKYICPCALLVDWSGLIH